MTKKVTNPRERAESTRMAPNGQISGGNFNYFCACAENASLLRSAATRIDNRYGQLEKLVYDHFDRVRQRLNTVQ